MNLEFIVNLWQNTIFPTFVKIINTFTTPINQIINNEVKDIPVLGWLLSAFTEIFPHETLIELIVGGAVIFTISIILVKFIVGIVT